MNSVINVKSIILLANKLIQYNIKLLKTTNPDEGMAKMPQWTSGEKCQKNDTVT